MTDPTIEGEITFSSKLETAFERLLPVIDNPPFRIDEELYIALSQLPLTHPWPSVTIVAVLSPSMSLRTLWLKLLSEAIVHGIFDLHHAAYTPPPLPGLLTSSRFWHAHLNHACTRATSPLAGAGTTDIMAGDELVIWNQVNARSNEPIPSTHLTIFVSPALGAFILANLKSPKEWITRGMQSISILCTSRTIQASVFPRRGCSFGIEEVSGVGGRKDFNRRRDGTWWFTFRSGTIAEDDLSGLWRTKVDGIWKCIVR